MPSNTTDIVHSLHGYDQSCGYFTLIVRSEPLLDFQKKLLKKEKEIVREIVCGDKHHL